jgi:PhnB protein
MHAALEINGSALLGSDDPTGDDGPKTGFSVSYNATDAADANSVFDRLAEGGEVTLPVSETFWSPAFGMLKDRFGISWMVGVPTAQA